MKKIISFILLLLVLSACQKRPLPQTIITVDTTNIPVDVRVADFNLNMIHLKITYPEGTSEDVVVNNSMLFQSDIEKLNSPGLHTITIQYKSLQKTVVINLLANETVQPTGITISGANSLVIGKSITLSAQVFPLGVVQEVIWSSLSPQIASVSSDGVVSGLKEGRAIIRAQSLVLSLLYQDYNLDVIKESTLMAYYQGAEGLQGQTLKTFLHNKIKGHTSYNYDFATTALRKTDEDPHNDNNLILFYTGRSQGKNTNGASGDYWNREHVWPKSHGNFGTSQPMGTDLHNLRPTDASVNSARSNLDFDNGGSLVVDTYGLTSSFCYSDGDSFEPRNEVKGDVARIIFYMAVRYEGAISGEVDLEIVDYVESQGATLGKLSTLLAWNSQDPVDDFERNRNEVIYNYQGNRNPFIDYPEFVSLIWHHLPINEDFKLIIYQIAYIYEEKNDYIFI